MSKVESRLAYEVTKSGHEAVRQQVYDFISNSPLGCTADDVASALGAVHNRVAPRLHELAQMGLVKETGLRRKTRQGCMAAIYRVAGSWSRSPQAVPRRELPVGYGLVAILDWVEGVNQHARPEAFYGPRRYWCSRDARIVTPEEVFA